MKKILIALTLLASFVTSAKFEVKSLPNGRIMVAKEASTPYQYIIMTFDKGASFINKKKQGTLKITSEILELGPLGSTEYDFKKKLFDLNSSIRYGVTSESFYVVVKAKEDKVEETLLLLKDIFLNPNLTKKTFKQAKSRVLNSRKATFNRMSTVTMYYGYKDALSNKPMAQGGSGSPKTIKRVQYNDVKTVLSLLSLNYVNFFTMGPVSENKIKEKISKILTPQEIGKINEKKLVVAPLISKRQSTIIHKKGAPDNQILFAAPLHVKPMTKDYYTAQVALEILGGGLNGRLSKDLRVKKGLTYHAGSYLRPVDANNSFWMIYSFGSTKNLSPIINGVPKIVNKLASDGVTDEELKLAKDILLTNYKKNNELPIDGLSRIMTAHIAGYPLQSINEYPVRVMGVTKEDVESFVRTHLKLDKMNLYLMGDKDKISKKIRGPKKVVYLKNIE